MARCLATRSLATGLLSPNWAGCIWQRLAATLCTFSDELLLLGRFPLDDGWPSAGLAVPLGRRIPPFAQGVPCCIKPGAVAPLLLEFPEELVVAATRQKVM